MTTKVQISIVQQHIPVVVEVMRSDGTIQFKHELAGESVCQEYVHSGQTLRVREMTTAEMHARIDEPPSCPHGVMAGACPHCVEDAP